LKVKEVWVGERRYVVCLNEEEARKDAADREAIVAALREQLRCGAKTLVGNKGYRRFLSGSDSPGFRIDEAKIAEDARYDGKWVLRTNTDLDAAEVALQYKRLWMVEQWFRSCKSLLQTRPIYHRRDETIRGHVFCSFLALVLRQELQARLEQRGHDPEWADVIGDLDRLQMVEVEQDGKRFLLRNNQPRPEAGVLGRPPRGGRLRGVAPFGGGKISRSSPTWGAASGRSPQDLPPAGFPASVVSASPGEPVGSSAHRIQWPTEGPSPKTRRIARSSSGRTARGRGFIR
jgi:hypothetical protein